MAEINLTTIQASDSIAGSRTVFNGNFTICKDAINELLKYLNTETLKLTGIKYLKVINGEDGTPNPSATTIETNGTISGLGNLSIGGTVTAKAVTLSNGTGCKISSGNLEQLSSSGITDIRGRFKLGNETVISTYASAIEAWKKATYISGGNNYSTIPGQPNNIIGHVSLQGKSGLILDFSGYNSGNVELNVNRVKLVTDNILTGHTCKIIVITDGVNNFQIEKTNLADPTGGSMSNGIKFTKSYQSLEVVYSGSAWVPVNLQSCTIF